MQIGDKPTIMRLIRCLPAFLLLTSCIPYSFAPEFEGTKLTKAKKFKRDLPNREALTFRDPGEEYEFYRFLIQRLDIDQEGPLLEVPMVINDKTYYLSYYERERATRTLNLLPMIMDAVLESNEIGPVLEENYTSRWGSWYGILTVTDADGKDCLSSKYKDRLSVANHLRLLHADYLNPMNALGTKEN